MPRAYHWEPQSYVSKGMELSVRNSYVSTLCPVVLCPYWCTSDVIGSPVATRDATRMWSGCAPTGRAHISCIVEPTAHTRDTSYLSHNIHNVCMYIYIYIYIYIQTARDITLSVSHAVVTLLAPARRPQPQTDLQKTTTESISLHNIYLCVYIYIYIHT